MSESTKTELSQLCKFVGSRVPLWTQGAGGNISLKDRDMLWIKATGLRLDAVKSNEGLAQVDFRKMAYRLDTESWSESVAEQKYADLIESTTVKEEGLGRASMETGFHARLSKKYVIHFHSLVALLICHELKKNKPKVSRWLNSATSLKWEWVEPCRPGWILSKRVSGDASIFFLESHGVILQSENSELLEAWEVLEKRFCQDFNYLELYELLASPLDFQDLFARYASHCIPFKCYFPDVAVFQERLTKLLHRNKLDLFEFPLNTVQRDKDMAELWLATQILFKICPGFEEVPQQIAIEVKDLPTEKLRQQSGLRNV